MLCSCYTSKHFTFFSVSPIIGKEENVQFSNILPVDHLDVPSLYLICL